MHETDWTGLTIVLLAAVGGFACGWISCKAAFEATMRRILEKLDDEHATLHHNNKESS